MMTKIKLPNAILMTTDTIGGVWTYSLDLCKVLQKHNINVYLATMGLPLSRSQIKHAASMLNVEVYESGYALEWMDDPWEEVDEAGQWLLNLEQELSPDIIHLNNYIHGSLPWQAPVLVVAHSCVLSWWEFVKGKKAPAEWNIYRQSVKSGLQHSDYLVAVSHHMMKCLQRYYGPITGAEVIYNGRDPKQFSGKNKEPIIFCMGRIWDEAKNISSLMKVSGNLSWPVFAAGDSDSDTVTKGMVQLGKLSQDKAANWLSKASIYVMPARYEPFGLSILEAALSECALVLGDIPSLNEIWGDSAVFINPQEPADLQEKINQLIDHPERLNEMGSKARKKAQYYSLERFERKYLNLYRSMYKNKEVIKELNHWKSMKISL